MGKQGKNKTVPTVLFRERRTSFGFDMIVVLTFKIHFDIELHTASSSANSAQDSCCDSILNESPVF